MVGQRVWFRRSCACQTRNGLMARGRAAKALTLGRFIAPTRHFHPAVQDQVLEGSVGLQVGDIGQQPVEPAG